MGLGVGTVGKGFGPAGAAATPPAAPTLGVTLSGTTATATINGDAGVTNHLNFKTRQESTWTDGGARAGDGTIEVAGLSEGTVYDFIAFSEQSGVFSEPSNSIAIEVPSAATQNIWDRMAVNTAPVFTKVYAEQVTYHPAGGGDRVVQAIVHRDPVGEIEGGLSPLANIDFENDTTTGVTSAESDRGGDAVSYPVKIGQAVARRPLKGIVSQDAGRIIREAV